MLRRLRVSGFKSLKEVDVSLKGLTVLFGPNAAGKSNVLDALQLVARMATRPTLKDAFSPPYRGSPLESVSFGLRGIKDVLEREHVHFSIQVDLELSDQVVAQVESEIREIKGERSTSRSLLPHRHVTYKVDVEVKPSSGLLRVSDELLALLRQDGQPYSKLPYVQVDGKRIHVRRQGGAGHPMFFERGLDRTVVSMSHYAPHYPYLVALRRELENWLFLYFEPREKMRSPGPVREVRHVGLMGEELPAFLNTIQADEAGRRQFKALELALGKIVPSATGIVTRVNEYGEVEMLVREGNMEVPASVASEGTLRTLGLLSLTAMHPVPGLIGFEEPENGIHPRRIRLIADFLRTLSRGTQLIVTTHSPVFIDMFKEDELFVCTKRDGCTVVEPYRARLMSGLFRQQAINEALDSEGLQPSERVLRGDLND